VPHSEEDGDEDAPAADDAGLAQAQLVRASFRAVVPATATSSTAGVARSRSSTTGGFKRADVLRGTAELSATVAGALLGEGSVYVPATRTLVSARDVLSGAAADKLRWRSVLMCACFLRPSLSCAQRRGAG
jgi:hypothetical protein